MESQQTVDEGEWKTYNSKKKSDNSKKPRDIAPKKIVKCWYDNNSWQHKILTDQFIYDNGESVLKKFNIIDLKSKYETSKNNYEKNNCFKDLMKVINEQTWKKEKVNFEKVKEEEVQEEVKEEVKKEVIDLNKSLVRENVSFASLFKN